MRQPRHNLPTFPTSFIGRAEEIAELGSLLDNPDCRLLTLVGPGGIGKTRLAVEIARTKLENFPDSVYFVPLQPLQVPDQVLAAVIDALPLQVSDDPKQDLLNYLREKRLLLVLDNFEHVLESAALVSDILTAAPHVCVLATSREVMRLQREWVRYVAGLTWPDDASSRQHNEHYSAVDLFADRAWRLNSTFSLADERKHVIRICQLLEGMPLALELAAGWIDTLPCAEIAAEIEQDLSILASDTRDMPDRHRSMRAVLDHSWQRLTVAEQAVFPKLSVFRGGFEREAAEQVAGATLRILSDLVRKSWLRMSGGRYDIQEVLRQYAHEGLLAARDSDATLAAHCRYYAAFMQQRAQDVKGRRQLGALDEIEADWKQLELGLETSH